MSCWWLEGCVLAYCGHGCILPAGEGENPEKLPVVGTKVLQGKARWTRGCLLES